MKATKELAYGTLSQNNQVRIIQTQYCKIMFWKYVQVNFITPGFTGKILDFSNADTAVDQYHRFKVTSEI